jgi:hypothetical protein
MSFVDTRVPMRREFGLGAPMRTTTGRIDDRDALLAGEPAGLGDDQIAALRALVPKLAAAAAALDAGPLPLALAPVICGRAT